LSAIQIQRHLGQRKLNFSIASLENPFDKVLHHKTRLLSFRCFLHVHRHSEKLSLEVPIVPSFSEPRFGVNQHLGEDNARFADYIETASSCFLINCLPETELIDVFLVVRDCDVLEDNDCVLQG
jgi:hypothetical protein